MKKTQILLSIILILNLSNDSLGQWNLLGNTGISTTSFLGTTDNKDLVIKTNNIERIRIGATGTIGITAPGSLVLNTTGTLMGFKAQTNENLWFYSSSLIGLNGMGVMLNAANDLNSSYVPLTIGASLLSLNCTGALGINLDPTGTGVFKIRPFNDLNLRVSGTSTAVTLAATNDLVTQMKELNFSGSKFTFNASQMNIGYTPSSLIGNANLYVKNGLVVNTNTSENLTVISGSLANMNGVALCSGNNTNTVASPMSFSASQFWFHNGSLFIGSNPSCTFPSDAKLAVNGKIYATAIQVKLSGTNGCFPDYVFEKEYKLLSLPEVEKYIKENKHLPEVPSALEVEEKGIDLAEMNTILLKKIEELTLHMIDMKKEIEVLKKR